MRIVEGHADIDDVDGFLEQIGRIGDEAGAAVQAFDARRIAGAAHLEAAVDRANRATDRGETIADDRAVEVLLYAAGRRQIDRALAIGVDGGAAPVAIVVDGGDEDRAAGRIRGLIDRADVVGEAADVDWIADFFGITPAERAATDATLEDLVVERVSLLALEA